MMTVIASEGVQEKGDYESVNCTEGTLQLRISKVEAHLLLLRCFLVPRSSVIFFRSQINHGKRVV